MGPAYALEVYNNAIEPVNRRKDKKKKQKSKKYGFGEPSHAYRPSHTQDDWRWRPSEDTPNPVLPNSRTVLDFVPLAAMHNGRKQSNRRGRPAETSASGFNLPAMQLPSTNWRLPNSQTVPNFSNQMANNSMRGIETTPPQPSTSYANAQQSLTQALFKSSHDTIATTPATATATASSLPNPDIGALNLGLPPPSNFIDTSNFIQNRYFILTVKYVNLLYASIYGNRWNFSTPLNEMRRVARESAPAKIFLLMHVNTKKRAAIFCYGQFRAMGSGQYKIDIDHNIRNFRPLYMMDVANDCEMTTEEGDTLYKLCSNLAKQKSYWNFSQSTE